jgi:hypothetical protein
MQLLPNWSRQQQSGYCHRLLDAGLVEYQQGSLMTSRRWQAAMARSALSLLNNNEEMQDERLPIVMSLRELLKPVPDDDVLCDLVFIMQFIEHMPVNELGRYLEDHFDKA